MTPGRIGVAGCGRMGLGMARALHRAGFDVTGFDVRPTEQFGDFAAHMVPDPQAFAADREAIITVVRDTAQTEALLFDEQAILATARPRWLIVSSTLSPRYFADLVTRVPDGIQVIDAPMSGAQIAADQARLSFMLGGKAPDLDALMPVFRAMGPKLHRMGGLGAGMTAKVLNNFVAVTSVAAVRQALEWADDLGLQQDLLLALMNDSSGQTWFGSNFDAIEFSSDGYDPENTVGILKKDVESCLDATDPEGNADLPQAVISAIAALRPRPKA